VAVTNGKGQQIFRVPPPFGGEFDVSPQTPWHHSISDFTPKFPISAVKDGDQLSVTVTIAISYTNIFNERTSRSFQLQAAKGEINSMCCTLKELGGSMELQRRPDLTRIPAIPAK
jgi:hypothetical protein